MQNKLRIMTFALLFLTMYLPIVAAQAQERDLLELYRLAKIKDPAVIRAAARLESGRAEKDIAVAALIPRVSANGAVRQFWHKVVDYSPTEMNGEYTGYSYGVGAGIPILNVPSYYQISASTAGINSAESGILIVHQDLIIRLVDAYIRCLKAKVDEKLYRGELNRTAKVLQQTEAFLNAGTVDIVAVYEAKARMDSAAADLVKTEGQLRLAQQNLASLTGVEVDSVKDITVTTFKDPQPVDMKWWLDTMRQHSPNLLQTREDLRQSVENRKGASAGHLPTLQGNGGYTVDKGSTFLPKVETQQWYVGISIDVPIYSGGETSARTRRALAGESERRAMLYDVEEQAIKRLKEAYLNLEYNVSLVEAYRRKFESAELQLKSMQKACDMGTRTAIELLNSEQSYAVSRRDLNSALYDNLQRRLELKSAAGILDENDLVELNGETTLDAG